MSIREDRERQLLATAATRDTVRPWHGTFGTAERLEKRGLLKDAGVSVMPPYKLYAITEAGLRALGHKP